MVKSTKRIKLHTNNSCNLKCRFCYYGDSACIKEMDASLEELKKQLKIAKNMGALDVDFSGGESTIRPDFPELIAYTKKLGFRNICVITNGLRMSNFKYAKKLVDAGLNDVLFSLEGHISKMHDYLTRVPGSFKKINQAIKNVKRLGIRCRINITVTKENYHDLEKFSKHIIQFQPDAVNFIVFNPWNVAMKESQKLLARYSDVAPYLKKSIDFLQPKVMKITIRYFPYCFMQGYEKHICNCLHNKYDADEWWIPKIQYKMETKANKKPLKVLKRIIKNLRYVLGMDPRYFTNFDKFILGLQLKKLYYRPKKCKKCKYYFVCDGIDKPYPKLYGLEEITPVNGEKIKNPMFDRGKYLEEYDKKFGF